jgi:hypothetical protein
MLDTYNIKKCNQHLLEEKKQHQRFGTKSIIEKKSNTKDFRPQAIGRDH